MGKRGNCTDVSVLREGRRERQSQGCLHHHEFRSELAEAPPLTYNGNLRYQLSMLCRVMRAPTPLGRPAVGLPDDSVRAVIVDPPSLSSQASFWEFYCSDRRGLPAACSPAMATLRLRRQRAQAGSRDRGHLRCWTVVP